MVYKKVQVYLRYRAQPTQRNSINKMTMELQDRTIALLDALEEADWFANIGKPDIDGAVVVNDWDEAIASCSTIGWENLQLEAVNLLHAKLMVLAAGRRQHWNEILETVKLRIGDLIDDKTKYLINERNVPKLFLDSVRWDFLNMCMESEYADVCPSHFYQLLRRIYLAGHFPCGWEGKFPYGPDKEFPYSWEGDLPNGKLVIY